MESGLSISSKGRGKAKEKDHKEAPKGIDLYHRARKETPFSLPSIYIWHAFRIYNNKSRLWATSRMEP